MNKNIQIFFPNLINLSNLIQLQSFRFIFVFLSGVLFLPIQEIRSEEVFLKCIGKYEINRGALIKPDWETIYVTINLDGFTSTIYENGIKKEGRTSIRGNSYSITHRDNRNNIKNIYKINETYGNYIVEHHQSGRTLIGSCQKGRG